MQIAFYLNKTKNVALLNTNDNQNKNFESKNEIMMFFKFEMRIQIDHKIKYQWTMIKNLTTIFEKIKWRIQWRQFMILSMSLMRKILIEKMKLSWTIQWLIYRFWLKKNMLQQTNNDDFFKHSTKMNCRICLCFKKKHDLKFDISNDEKYHWHVMQNRQKIKSKQMNDEKIRNFCKNTKMKLKLSSIVKIISIFNIVFTKTYDAFHFEWRDFERILQKLFFYIDQKRISKIFENFSKISIFVI